MRPSIDLSYRQLLRVPDVPALLVAACQSRLAARMMQLALVLHVLARFHSPALAGWIVFVSLVPGIVISPLAGALLDRMGAAKGVLIDMAASAVLVAAMVTADRLGALDPPLLLVLVGFYSLTGPLGAAGLRALFPRLVPEPALDRVNALDSSSYALIDVIGPLLAGVISGFAGTNVTLLVIALLYVAASASLLRLAQRPYAPVRSHTMLREAIAGLTYVLRHPALRGLAVSYALYQVSWGILVVAVPVLVTRELGLGGAADATTGILWAVSGIAGAVGALLAGSMRTSGREAEVIAASTLLTAVAIYPLGVSLGLAGLAIGLALAGFLAGPADVGLLTLRQRATDPDRLGRVLAVSMSFNMSGLPLGSALAGHVVPYSLNASMLAAAAAALLAGAAALMLVRA
jgi:MFS family permease